MSRFESDVNADLSFSDLFTDEGLNKLDAQFLARLKEQDERARAALLAYRRDADPFTPLQTSNLLLACAPVLEEHIAQLFGINKELETSRQAAVKHNPVSEFKKQFVQKRAKRRAQKRETVEHFSELDAWLETALARTDHSGSDRELAVAIYARQLLSDETANAAEIEKLTRWCVSALTTSEGTRAVAAWPSFRLPQPVDPRNLVPIKVIAGDSIGRLEGPPEQRRRRDGFKLTDPRMNGREVQDQINYCVFCHEHDGDFCSKGFPEKKGQPEKGLKDNALGVTLTGCPLDEKVSEMHALKRDGATIAALAMVMADNPMCPATGHRICNDCMKACIYQKQEPVNIPQIETRVLTDVLALPWGVEIYDLLTRWNPLRARQWLPKPYNGLKVLIAGMGPAGFTLAHHLLMEGFAIVGTEGLKIEPLPPHFIDQPVREYRELEEDLDTRVMAGFGGVAEYGITTRWDKNFLKLIYLSLMRRRRFQVFGGIRFGGTVTVEDAWTLGIDHVAIAVGAGLPLALPVPGSLAPGMRQANDFLMALQLTGAAKADSLANLQVRLPAVVIGGGLTGVDTATEVQAHYIAQVEKTLQRYEALSAHFGEPSVRIRFDQPSLVILDEFLEHGRAVRIERERAGAADETPNFLPLIRQWGGVTIAYRRALNESPAYTRNHEEIIKALEEGIFYAEGLDPKSAKLDDHGDIEAMVFARQRQDADGSWRHSGEETPVPARSVFVATGARPNVAYEFEHRGHFAKEHGHYRTHHSNNDTIEAVPVALHCKVGDFGPFTSYQKDHRRVSFIGDTHPVFHGSVVKAIASGLRTYPKIVQALAEKIAGRGDEQEYIAFREHIRAMFETRIESLKRLNTSAIELRIRAPMAARKFRPGQFFRVQNFETCAPRINGTRLQTEALAMTGAKVDPDTGLISLIVLEQGASSRLCATFRPGDPIALMGPTGVRTKIPDGGETILIVGGRLGVAHMLGVGPAMRKKGNRVILVAGFPSASDIICKGELESSADVVVWSTRAGEPVRPCRPRDRAASGDIVEVIRDYASGRLEPHGGEPQIRLQDVDRFLVVGGNRLIRRIRDARYGDELKEFFPKQPKTLGSISTPMQCMLKGVCSQCLQWQIDPETGHRTKAVFSCSWQDQPLDIVDLNCLDDRLGQNRVQERLTDLWLDHLLQHHEIPRI
jgi:NADPH-dependent glutamate synthase beta subunit-like oxidoreductase/NAD(P)H-flavin reductase